MSACLSAGQKVVVSVHLNKDFCWFGGFISLLYFWPSHLFNLLSPSPFSVRNTFHRHLHLVPFQCGIPRLCFMGVSHPGAPALPFGLTLPTPCQRDRIAPENPLALAVNSLLHALRPGRGWEAWVRSRVSWSTFYSLSFNGLKVIINSV